MAGLPTICCMNGTRRTTLYCATVCGVAGLACSAPGFVGARVAMHPDFEHSTQASGLGVSFDIFVPADAQVPASMFAEIRAMGADVKLVRRGDSIDGIPANSLSLNGLSGDGLSGIGLSSRSSNNENWNTDGYDSAGVFGDLLNVSDGELSPGSNMRFTVGRNTTLNDGNIAGSAGSLPGQGDSVASMTQREGEYNFYDMMVEWQAATSGPVEFSLTSGVTAIEANVSKQVNSGGTSTIHDVSHRVIAVPTIGSAVTWNISKDWSLTGKATTQSINIGSSLIGFNAQTDWRISDRVGLSAGYQLLRSEFDLGAVTSDLNQEGLFARLQIRF